MTYSAEALATGSVKAYFRTRRSITVTSSASATATSNISYEDAYKIALGTAQNIANSAAQNDANVMQVSVDTSTIGETEIYLDSSLLKDYVSAQGNTYTLNRDFALGGGLTLLLDSSDKFSITKGVILTINENSTLKVLGTLYNDGTLNCLGVFNNLSNNSTYNTGSFTTSTGTNPGTIFNGYNPKSGYNNEASYTILTSTSTSTSSTFTNSGAFFNLAIFINSGCTFTNTGVIVNGYDVISGYYNNEASFTISSLTSSSPPIIGSFTNSGTFYNLAILNNSATFTNSGKDNIDNGSPTTDGFFYCVYEDTSTSNLYFSSYIVNTGFCSFQSGGTTLLVGYILNNYDNIVFTNGSIQYQPLSNGTGTMDFGSQVIMYNNQNTPPLVFYSYSYSYTGTSNYNIKVTNDVIPPPIIIPGVPPPPPPQQPYFTVYYYYETSPSISVDHYSAYANQN